MILGLSFNTTNHLPLGADISTKKMKPLFLDIGLVQYNSGVSDNDILGARDLSNIYKGALAEQFVGREIVAAGVSEAGRMYHWARDKKNSSAKIDYLYVFDGNILPIEVKSGPKGKLKSLHFFTYIIPVIPDNGFSIFANIPGRLFRQQEMMLLILSCSKNRTGSRQREIITPLLSAALVSCSFIVLCL